MASPLPVIPVTNHYVDLANGPAEGHVSLTPLVRVAKDGYIVVGRTVTGLVRNGVLSTTIVADSAGLSGHLYVRVVETIQGAPTVSYVVQPNGDHLDLALAPRLCDPPPGQLYVPATALGQPGGVATLGTDGILTESQRPPALSTPGPVFVYTQQTPATVITIQHDLGRRPAAVALFSPDFSEQYDEYEITHLSVNSLRIGMDVPTACTALIE